MNANETFHMQFVDMPAFILVTLEIMMMKIRAGPRIHLDLDRFMA